MNAVVVPTRKDRRRIHRIPTRLGGTHSVAKAWSAQSRSDDRMALEIFCKGVGIPHEAMNLRLKRLSSTQLLPLR